LYRCITIFPIGLVEGGILDLIAGCIQGRCGVVCKVSSPMENPRYAYDEKRGQYNSKLILKRLARSCPENSFRVMGVTRVDLFVPILKYVFGLAEIDGQGSIISAHRLYPEFYDLPSDPDLFMARVEKTALHELGHSLGLTHCRNRRCVMYSSTQIEHTDFKNADYCPTCSELFRWCLEKSMTGP
jgi:archaemetzincin